MKEDKVYYKSENENGIDGKTVKVRHKEQINWEEEVIRKMKRR